MNTSPNQQADWALAKRPHCARAEPSPSRARAESGSPDQPGRALTTKSHLAPRMGRACARAAPSELEPNQSRARGKPGGAGGGGWRAEGYPASQPLVCQKRAPENDSPDQPDRSPGNALALHTAAGAPPGPSGPAPQEANPHMFGKSSPSAIRRRASWSACWGRFLLVMMDDGDLVVNPPTPCQIGKHPPAL